jgi:hypothetical protein
MNSIEGYRCKFCNDIVYKRNIFDVHSHCRCGNISLTAKGVKSVRPGGYSTVNLELGEGVDETILHYDYIKNENNYGVIHSTKQDDELYPAKAEILLLKEKK